MKVQRARFQSFKRFTDLTIEALPPTVRLVLLIGPNGAGKSCVFDGFRLWQGLRDSRGHGWTPQYHQKQGESQREAGQLVEVEFHEPTPPDTDKDKLKKLFYFRSAYRNEPDFSTRELQRVGRLLDVVPVPKMIDNDITVSTNYRRLVSDTVDSVYAGQFDSISVRDLRNRLLGKLSDSVSRVLGNLHLRGPGKPLEDGTFLFEKGASVDFRYQNLSGGEKSAFDLLLDLVVKCESYDATIFCIDEPELHMHTQLQAKLLEEMQRLIPPGCQLWLATHSLGMMRKAQALAEANPGEVVFLDFREDNFDVSVTKRPAQVSRSFWKQVLSVALDDLAHLVAPEKIVLCEGRAANPGDPASEGFDACCYRGIFGNEFPNTEFISVGNSTDVQTDRLWLGRTIHGIVNGTTVFRVIDRDNRSQAEVEDFERRGVRVLSRRHLESYLLDEEVLDALCDSVGKPEKKSELRAAHEAAISDSVGRNNAADDIKSAAGKICNAARSTLGLQQAGHTTSAFLRDTMSPLVVPGMKVYEDLKEDVFGS